MKKSVIGVMFLLMGGAVQAEQATVTELLKEYAGQGVSQFSASSGETLWNQQFTTRGEARSCATCHNADLTKPGKHATTGKVIEPMAPSVNPKRLSDRVKVEKWFTRNCKWTLGRECSAQEKGDFLSFIQNQ